MQSQRLAAPFDGHLYSGVKMFVFAIVCGGLVVGLVDAQRHDLTFRGPVERETLEDHEAPVPVEIARRLNSINSIDEFLKILHNLPVSERGPTLAKSIYSQSYYRRHYRRFGDAEIEERSNWDIATPAACIPEPQVVPLKQDDDPSTFVFPPCTRINRCGGCCSSSLLTCQPKATTTRNFRVIVSSMQLNYQEHRIVPLEEHTKCHCDCRIKAKDCSERQRYEANNCMCRCINEDEAEKCYDNREKQWNPSHCSCSCRNTHECSTGNYFDHNTCRCQQIIMFRPVNRFASTKDSNYDFANTRQEPVPPVIIPLGTSDPRRKHKEDPEYK